MLKGFRPTADKIEVVYYIILSCKALKLNDFHNL